MTSRTPNHQFPAPEEVRRHAHDEGQVSPPAGSGPRAPCEDGQPQPWKDQGSQASAAPSLRSSGHGPTGPSNLQMVAGRPTPKALGWARTGREPEVVWVAFLTQSSSVPRVAGSAPRLRGQMTTTHARGPQEELAVVKAGSSSSSVKFPGSVSLSLLSPHLALS